VVLDMNLSKPFRVVYCIYVDLLPSDSKQGTEFFSTTARQCLPPYWEHRKDTSKAA
jgi:hypothetical protein